MLMLNKIQSAILVQIVGQMLLLSYVILKCI